MLKEIKKRRNKKLTELFIVLSTHINHSAAALKVFSLNSQGVGKNCDSHGLISLQQAAEAFYLVLCARDAREEDEDGHKEADGQVQVDFCPRTLDGADRGEGQDAEEEADQRQGQTHPGHQLQVKLVLFTEKSHTEGQEKKKKHKTNGSISAVRSRLCSHLHLIKRHEHREAAQVVAGT